MTKIIVTHANPDLDAICSVWLFKKFDQDFSQAKVCFVVAGETYKDQVVDSDDNIIHVDTGMGRFDHHQLTRKTCAALLVFNYLKSKRKDLKNNQALVRLIKVVKQVDHFDNCLWSDPDADLYSFFLEDILDGLKTAGKLDDQGLIEFGSQCFDGIYTALKIKIKAEEDLAQGYQFKTKWGKAIGCLSHNNEVLKLGQKMGYTLVVQKDSQTEHVRIKARPDSLVDLSKTYEKLKQLDSQATWFLHISKKMLLNGSSKNFKMKPSRLSLKKIIDVLEEK